jgi:hypothetical protein
MPYSDGVDNRTIRFRRNGTQFKLEGSKSATQIFQQNLLPISHRLWAYVCSFGLGLMEKMAMAIAMAMVIVTVLVIVIIAPEVLRQVDWLCQRQHQSFHRPRAFY